MTDENKKELELKAEEVKVEAEVSAATADKGEVDLSVLEGFSFGPRWSGDVAKGEKRGGGKSFGGGRKFGGPRREGGGARVDRRGDRGARTAGGGGSRPAGGGARGRRFQREVVPEFASVLDVEFYPEDAPFNALIKSMKSTCKTYELFEVAHLILEKPERFVVVMKPLEKGKKFYVSPFDGVPFETEEGAIGHGLKLHMGNFFNMVEIDLDAPKGNFPSVNKCGMTGELLGPANFHRYGELVKRHWESNLSHVPFERFEEKIESVKDDEQVAAWVEKMKKGVRYTLKKVEEGKDPELFDTYEEARAYVLANHRAELVKEKDQLRMSGVNLEKMPRGDFKRSIEVKLAEQRKFPLSTANNLRGRMRRMKFAIYKRKDKKGVSYVSAVKRKFRNDKTVFTEELTKVVEFIEANENVLVTELGAKYLGFDGELDAEQQAAVKKILMNLRWLVSEGYVVEYGDGKLFANPKGEEPVEQAKPVQKKAAVKTEEKTEAPKEVKAEAVKTEEAKVEEKVKEFVENVAAEEEIEMEMDLGDDGEILEIRLEDGEVLNEDKKES